MRLPSPRIPTKPLPLVEAIGPRSATVRYQVDTQSLRPGGTVSVTTADVGLYAAILGEIGIVALAVTTNLNINFLRKPSADKDIIGECKLIKVGRQLITGEVVLYSEGRYSHGRSRGGHLRYSQRVRGSLRATRKRPHRRRIRA